MMRRLNGVIVLALFSMLTGCYSNPQFGEYAYLQDTQLPTLKLPQELQNSVELKPIYQVPEGKTASHEQEKVSPLPPSIL